ncbi:hypothetical protein [Neisseria yangbaofengii]|uniref:hypothetical protein n=1 Tax=Neisseria yangbaofengii TaxID=2709396 RepID=UPI0013EB9FE9|nr:hypothetical protein [Neisseria yangbaofengii]
MNEYVIKIRETENGLEVDGIEGVGQSSSAAQMAAYMLTMAALSMAESANENPDGFRSSAWAQIRINNI